MLTLSRFVLCSVKSYLTMSAKISLRKDCSVYLIGHYTSQIIGNKLPSIRQALLVLFYNMREVKLSLRESATLTLKEVSVFWDKSRIPTRRDDHCIEKLEKLHAEWRALQKSGKRPSSKAKEQIFVEKLDDLFDISHANALELLKIDEDKQFLINQRKKGRPGYMHGIDYHLASQEEAATLKSEKLSERLQRCIQEKSKIMETVALSSSSSTSSSPGKSSNNEHETDKSQEEVLEEEPGPSNPKKQRLYGQRNIVTPKIVAAFDACKISDRYGVHILIAVVEALGYDAASLSISRSTLRRTRQQMRKERSLKLKTVFGTQKLLAPVIHWDGKLLPSLTEIQNVDRLAVLITSGDIEQLLAVPALPNSTGREQAAAVYEVLVEWNLESKVIALCCDTTASNMGHLNGAATILQQMLERDILYFPCRHHIFEVVLKSVFDIKMPLSSGPNVALFKRFKEFWPKIDQNKVKTGMQTEEIKHILKPFKSDIAKFIDLCLTIQQPRDDYKELLLLSKLFIEEQPSHLTFYRPGAFHHARWMSKAIYCLKIYFFQDQFKLTQKERSGISDICLFIVKLYIKAWFNAPYANKAPFLDLELCKELIEYKNIDKEISEVSRNKLINHLWYLNPANVSLSFFDDEISVVTKRAMVEALKKIKPNEEGIKRLIINDINDIKNKKIEDFISNESKTFFDKLSLPTEFLTTDPATWSENFSYKQCLEIVKKLKVVNDAAERGIKLISEYNPILTKNEEQKQFLLQVVKDYKSRFPNVKKETLLRVLE